MRSRDTLFARYQKAAGLIWPHLMGGCHVERRIQAAIGQVFMIDGRRSFRFPPAAAFSPVAARIVGVARKADTPGSWISAASEGGRQQGDEHVAEAGELLSA